MTDVSNITNLPGTTRLAPADTRAGTDDAWLRTLEDHFNRLYEEEQKTPPWDEKGCGDHRYQVVQRLMKATNQLVSVRAQSIEGVRIKLRAWIKCYGDGLGDSEDSIALIESLAFDLGVHPGSQVWTAF